MPMQVTSYYHRTNPDEAGYSLGNFFEVWAACFEAASVRSVMEVGAERGRLTQELLRWAAPSGAHVTAIEPEPISDLLELLEEYPDLEIVEETSLDALTHLPIADAVVLDGDHNYYTLSGELRLIAERRGAHAPARLSRRLLAARPPGPVRSPRPDPAGASPPLRRGHQAGPGEFRHG